MSEQPLHDWLRPRLLALLQQAQQAGFDPGPAAAVIADIMMASDLNLAPLPDEPATRQVRQLPGVRDEYPGPDLGSIDWIKPTGQP